jgi:hypothetical protein
VVAEQERAERDPGALGIGPPDDDELLPGLALELQPVPGAPARVRRVRALGDQALPALAADVAEPLLTAADPVRGVADRVVPGEQLPESALAVEQRLPAYVLAARAEHVEHVEEDSHAAAPRLRGTADVDPRLESGEARA